MIWNRHSNLVGAHAFLGASNYHWLNYDSDKVANTFLNMLAKQKGTELHDFAAQAIKLGQKLPKSRKTLNMYVNDAIGFKMTPEQVLFYSDNAFGTADAICFRNEFLRVHDLKTGVSPTSMNQVYIYMALFCLEYQVKPSEIGLEGRIYQSDDIEISNPEPKVILDIMNKIIEFDKIINKVKLEGV